jgi:hypothetical protein
MAQSTWAAESGAWSGTSYVWANTTYTDTVTLATNATQVNTGLTIYPSTAVIAANSTLVSSGGFQLVGAITLGLDSGFTTSSQQVFVESVTLASTGDMSSIGNKLYVESITMGTTVNFPLSGTTTWNLETATWANADGYWGYSPPVALSVAANITQVMLSSLNAEDVEKIATALMPTDLGVSATVTVIMPLSGTIANEQNMKFNINFEESVGFAMASNTTSINNFLWNDEAEDTGTTWTKV